MSSLLNRDVETRDAAAMEAEELVARPRNGPYESDLEYLQDMFQLVKLRADIARVRRHMEERGQQMANTRGGAGGGEGDEEGSDEGSGAFLVEKAPLKKNPLPSSAASTHDAGARRASALEYDAAYFRVTSRAVRVRRSAE